MSTDIHGRLYAILKNCRCGDKLEADGGFDCIQKGTILIIDYDRGFYVPCTEGSHYLEGQLDETGSLVGFYPIG